MSQTKFNEFLFIAPAESLRLDRALATDPRIISRSQATSLIDRGFVTLDGKPVKPAYKAAPGETFRVLVPIEERTELTPFDFPLDIVFEDEHVLVVNKPSGLVVHPAVGHRQNTLVNALVHHTQELAKGFTPGRPGIVHRIDKDTSGLLVVAKTETALRVLAKQFKNKTIHRVYWALVYGVPNTASGSITSYIRRHPVERKKFASERLQNDRVPTGKLAITHYDVEKVHPSKGLSLVHCRLETGRTHQIRVHMSELGHPIVADPFYCSSHRLRTVQSVRLRHALEKVPHLMLHAAELGFKHPATGEWLEFSRPWPDEILSILREMELC